jgi:capsular exopolysaccharide synthesis family protein
VLNGILTQVDVVQSKALIRRSIQSLPSTEGIVPAVRIPPDILHRVDAVRNYITKLFQTDETPESDPLTETINYVQDHLRVESKENSSVITVKYEAGSPTAAAAVVNAIMATYVSTVGGARETNVATTDQWISRQMAAYWHEVEVAEQRVADFMKDNPNVTEVQGTLTANLKLSKGNDQLALAREDLARQQAALNTIQRNGGAGADEILNSKSIQALKEIEAKAVEQLSSLYESDPRRAVLKNKILGTRALIKSESDAVIASISRGVEIARARVKSLEASNQKETDQAQVSTVASVTLRQLMSDLEAKRLLYVEFLKGAGQAQLASVRAPMARILFQGAPPPKPLRSMGLVAFLLGFIGGGAGAAGTIVMRTALGRKITSPNEMVAVTGLPVFGSLPDLDFARGSTMLLPGTQPIVTETFRGMWLAMRTPQMDGAVILVTSSEAGEGKTTMAVALARSFADDGLRVLLVDADLRRPRLRTLLKLKPEYYLESVLDGTATFEDALVHDEDSGLTCVLSDGSCKSPLVALSSDRFKDILHQGKQSYDFVIIDSAPVLRVADPTLLASLCQHIVFIVQSRRASNELVAAAVQRFSPQDRDKILTLLTRVRAGDLSLHDYYSGYAGA